ncbi:MAG: VOC family protein [Nitrososphaerota archaeon]
MKTKFQYTGIRVKNLDESIKFYTELLGMKLLSRKRVEENKGELATLSTDNGDFYLELNHYDRDSQFYSEYIVGEALDHLAFRVSNLAEAINEAKKQGNNLLAEIKTRKSRWVYIQDPNGIWIEFLE